jgi:uncharacterized membrane protein
MSPFFLLMQLAILAYALVGGVFLAFSDFIMRSLSLTGGTGGVEAMQVINREVFRWVFMALFLGMAAVSLAVAGYGATHLAHPSGALILLAGLIYLVGCFGVTVVFNVPMNEALASMDLSEETTRAYWSSTYLPRWTFWNTVRTVACGLSAALLLFGLQWMTHVPAQQAGPLQELRREPSAGGRCRAAARSRVCDERGRPRDAPAGPERSIWGGRLPDRSG